MLNHSISCQREITLNTKSICFQSVYNIFRESNNSSATNICTWNLIMLQHACNFMYTVCPHLYSSPYSNTSCLQENQSRNVLFCKCVLFPKYMYYIILQVQPINKIITGIKFRQKLGYDTLFS